MYVKKKDRQKTEETKQETQPLFTLEPLPVEEEGVVPESIVLPEESVFSKVVKETDIAITVEPNIVVKEETPVIEPEPIALTCYEVTCLDGTRELTLFSLRLPVITEQGNFILIDCFQKGTYKENILGKLVSVDFANPSSFKETFKVDLTKGLFLKAVDRPSWFETNEEEALKMFNEKSLETYREVTKNLMKPKQAETNIEVEKDIYKL